MSPGSWWALALAAVVVVGSLDQLRPQAIAMRVLRQLREVIERDGFASRADLALLHERSVTLWEADRRATRVWIVTLAAVTWCAVVFS